MEVLRGGGDPTAALTVDVAHLGVPHLDVPHLGVARPRQMRDFHQVNARFSLKNRIISHFLAPVLIACINEIYNSIFRLAAKKDLRS